MCIGRSAGSQGLPIDITSRRGHLVLGISLTIHRLKAALVSRSGGFEIVFVEYAFSLPTRVSEKTVAMIIVHDVERTDVKTETPLGVESDQVGFNGAPEYHIAKLEGHSLSSWVTLTPKEQHINYTTGSHPLCKA
jgi:hypothetical protein